MPAGFDDAKAALDDLSKIAVECTCSVKEKIEAVKLTSETLKLTETPQNMVSVLSHMQILYGIIKICGCRSRESRSSYLRDARNIAEPFIGRSKACPEYPSRYKLNGGYHVVIADKETGLYTKDDKVSRTPYATKDEAKEFASATSKMIKNILKNQRKALRVIPASEIEMYG